MKSNTVPLDITKVKSVIFQITIHKTDASLLFDQATDHFKSLV